MDHLENSTGLGGLNGTEAHNSKTRSTKVYIIAASFILLVSVLGIIGNSLVMWYLCLRIKRTKYTVYIINLAVADFIYLLFIALVMCIFIFLFATKIQLAKPMTVFQSLEIILGLGNYADMFFLTVISVERCLAVVFPMWYRYSRPKFQSALVCAIIWALSAFVTLMDNLGCPSEIFGRVTVRCTGVHTFLSVLVLVICIPVMVASSVIMLIMVRITSKQVQTPKLVIVIVVTVIVFLLSVAPMRLLWLLLYLHVFPSSFSASIFFFTVYLLTSLNSTINPLIYFLVGRHNMQGVWEYLEKALKNVFREEEEEVHRSAARGHNEGDTKATTRKTPQTQTEVEQSIDLSL